LLKNYFSFSKNNTIKTLIAGLGNPILSDDGVGWVIAQKIGSILSNSYSSIAVECFDLAGLALMEQMVGFERVIIIDAIYTGRSAQGAISTFRLDSLADLTRGHSASAHDLTLKKALALGRSLNTKLPEDKNIWIVAVEAQKVYEFGETLTPAIKAAVPQAIQEVFNLLGSKLFNIDNEPL